MPHVTRNYDSPYDVDSFWDWYESAEELTTAIFVKITPNAIWSTLPTLGFTSLDTDVVLANHSDLNFISSVGLQISAIEMEAGKPANLEIPGAFEGQFQEQDVLTGKWNNATVEIFTMNYEALGMGEWVNHTGIITKIKILSPHLFRAEIEGLSSKMQTNFGSFTTKTCRNTLGDAGCKKSLSGTIGGFNLTKTLTVHSVPSRKEIWFTRIEDVPDEFYENGTIEGVSATNDGIVREIRAGAGFGTSYVKVYLKRPFPLTVSASETFKLKVGCNLTLERCQYFSNVINRAAEDFLPTIENAAKVIPAV